jgi:hypothetical protein
MILKQCSSKEGFDSSDDLLSKDISLEKYRHRTLDCPPNDISNVCEKKKSIQIS